MDDNSKTADVQLQQDGVHLVVWTASLALMAAMKEVPGIQYTVGGPKGKIVVIDDGHDAEEVMRTIKAIAEALGLTVGA